MECVACLPVQRAAGVADALGVTPAVVRRLIAEGTLVRLGYGVVAGSCVVEAGATDPRLAHKLATEALLLRYDEAVASQESAAIAHGMPLLHLPATPRLTREAGAWRGGESGRVRVAPLPPSHVTRIGCLDCTTVPRTVIDIARSLPLADAAVVGDFALRWRCTKNDLCAVLAECSAWADVGKARVAIDFFDPRAESPLESFSRVAMHELDVPAPDLQHEVVGASGQVYRADFYWEAVRLIGEADGFAKYRDDRRGLEAALLAEKLREDDLREAGYGFIRWTYAQMLRERDATIARIQRMLGG